MKETVILDVQVKDGDIDELNNELNKTAKSFNEVETQSKKASVGVDEVTKNGGAIATLDKLTGGLATRFKELYEASGLFNGNLKAMRVALVATGIGAFVVAVGLVVAYWDEIKDYVFQTTKNLERQLESTRAIAAVLETELSTMEKQRELNRLRGESNEQLELQQIAQIQRMQEQNDRETELLEKQLAMLKLKSEEVGYWDQIVGAIKFQLFGTTGLQTHAAGLAFERMKQIKDLEDAIESAKGKAVDLSIQMFKLQNPDTPTETGGEGMKRPKVEAVGGIKSEDQAKLESFNEYLNELQPLIDKELVMYDEAGKYKKSLEGDIMDAKIQIAQRGLGLIMNGMEQGSKAYKAFAIAQATISTYEGANAAFKSASASPITTFFPAYPFLQAGLAVGAGIMQVKNIMKTNPKGGGGAPSRGGSMPSGGSIPQPNFNIVGDSRTNQLSDAINGQVNKPMKAYVVHKDVKTADQLDKDAIRSASI
jgi:hypothetical protein